MTPLIYIIMFNALLLTANNLFVPHHPPLAQSNIARANTVIEPTVFVSPAPVPRGRAFDLAIVLKIRPGFHVNAHEASEDFLIPTEVTAELPPGFRAAATIYPKGSLRKFSFSQKKLNVYEESVTVRMKLEALDAAPLGLQKLALKLRYQACTNELCLPPVTLPITTEFQVAERGAKSQPAHPNIFSPAQRSKPSSSKHHDPIAFLCLSPFFKTPFEEPYVL